MRFQGKSRSKGKFKTNYLKKSKKSKFKSIFSNLRRPTHGGRWR